MKKLLKRFVRSETGAVTVDWVVLCAAIVALAAAIVASMQANSLGLTADVNVFMDAQDPN